MNYADNLGVAVLLCGCADVFLDAVNLKRTESKFTKQMGEGRWNSKIYLVFSCFPPQFLH